MSNSVVLGCGLALGCGLVLGCGPSPGGLPETPRAELSGLVRLGDLVPDAGLDQRTLATDLVLSAGKPFTLPVDLVVPAAAGFEIRASGGASMLHVNWLLDGEEAIDPERYLVVVLKGDGEEHLHSVRLEGHPAWIGRIRALQLTVDRDGLEIHEIRTVDTGSPYRQVELGRVLVPSIAGRERLEIPLGPVSGGARQAVFETRLGVLSADDGIEARFSAWIDAADGRTPWFEATWPPEDTAARPAATWQLERHEVSVPGGATLVLETEVRRGGEPLAPEMAFWGNPRLTFASSEPPLNLVVIGVDTLRADVLGAYGDGGGLTPRIDDWARRSIRFDDLAAPAPWTLPSFASLLTGLHPQSHGAGRNLGGSIRLRDAPITPLGAGLATLPRILSEAGFLTAGFYSNPYLGSAFGLHRSYDEYEGFDPEVRAVEVVDRVVETLARVREGRFFFFIHLLDPHTPYEPPESGCEQARTRIDGARPAWPCRVVRSQHREKVPQRLRPWAEALYRGEVEHVDQQVGRLLTALESEGVADRTVVLLVSDHGEEFWEHEATEQRLGYQAISDHGHSHYQELLHVPAILSVPGQGPAEIEAPVEMVDFFPTLLRTLGIEAPPSQGRDLRELIEGHEMPEPLRLSDYLLYGKARWAARRGRWKLIVQPGEEPVIELYNLDDDPDETHDLSGEERGVVLELSRAARAELARREELRKLLGAAGSDQPAQLLEEELERLRALGYVE